MSKATESLSRNAKVMQYLHHSSNRAFNVMEQVSSNNFLSIEQHRSRSTSEYDSLSSSASSVNDSLSRSDTSVESSLSDPVAHRSIISFNVSSDEELDFNLVFEQTTDDDEDEQLLLNQHHTDADILHGESQIEEYLRQSSSSTIFDDEYDLSNNNTLTDYYSNQRASFLHDSTFTLCSPDRFSAYTEDEPTSRLSIRSNSLSILSTNDQSEFVEKASKKGVHFADMMGFDLESVRYMTPPDQTTTSILQECIRLQLGQLHFSRNSLDSSKRTLSTSLLPSPTKQYNLLSRHFTPPINITPIIYEKQVLLECLYTKESAAYGTIRVHNCAYDKQVFVRLTENEWETSNDLQAAHSMNYPHDNTDTFTFQITLPKSTAEINGPKRILFAVCFQAMQQEFWDNNQGWNYVLDVFERR